MYNLQKLVTLQKNIGLSLIDDCITYLGLHKFINFDDLEQSLKLVFMSLFTRFKHESVTTDYLSWLEQLKSSANECSFTFLLTNHLAIADNLIEYIQHKVTHYKLIQQLLIGSSCKERITPYSEDVKKYTDFFNNSIWIAESWYPFTPHDVVYLDL